MPQGDDAPMTDAPTFDGKKLEFIPQELRDLRAWTVTELREWDGERFTQKLTLIPDTGRHARCDKPNDWREWEEALADCDEHTLPCLARTEDLLILDLDDCFEGNELKPWAQKIVERLPTYTEISSSGKGLHLFLRTEGFEQRNRKFPADLYTAGATGEIEFFGGNHFVTMTGSRFADTPATVATLPRALKLLEALDGKKRKQKAPTEEGKAEPSGAVAVATEALTDWILQNPKIASLWNSGGNDGASEGDLSLANHLCRYCGDDPRLIEVLMRQSQRLRSKWDSQRRNGTWIQETIQKAIESWDGTMVPPPAPSQPTGGRKPYAFTTVGNVARSLGEQEWLWEDWLPVGHLSELIGQPSIGKTFLAQEIALVVTGQIPTFPDGSRPPRTGTVLWCDYEGQLATLNARILEAGCDPDHGLIAVACEQDGLAQDLPDFTTKPQTDSKRKTPTRELEIIRLITEAKTLHPDLCLVVVDSLFGATPGLDENSKAIAQPLNDLARLASRLQLAILILHHARKPAERKNEQETAELVQPINLSSIRGHSSIGTVPRSILALDLPVDSPARRLRLIKHSLVAKRIAPEPLGILLENARVIPTDAPVTEICKTRTTLCVEWLEELLQDGPMLATEVQERADLRDFGGVLREAKRRARIEAYRDLAEGESAIGQPWFWRLP